MAGNPGENAFLLDESLSLTSGANQQPGQKVVLYNPQLARGKSSAGKVGSNVMLVSEQIAQGQGLAQNEVQGNWELYQIPSGTVTQGSDPLFEFNHDGSATSGEYLRAWNDYGLTGDWDITFYGVFGSRTDPQNNLALGATANPGSDERLFDSAADDTVYAINEEGQDGSGGETRNEFIWVPNGDDFNTSPSIDTGEPPLGDIRFEKRGSDVTCYYNNVEKGTLTIESNTYHAAISLEDDDDVQSAETVTVNDVQIIDL